MNKEGGIFKQQGKGSKPYSDLLQTKRVEALSFSLGEGGGGGGGGGGVNVRGEREIKLYFSTVKIAQRPTHRSAVATVLLITKTFIEKYYDGRMI